MSSTGANVAHARSDHNMAVPQQVKVHHTQTTGRSKEAYEMADFPYPSTVAGPPSPPMPPPQNVTIALLQLYRGSISARTEKAMSMFADAVAQGADIVSGNAQLIGLQFPVCCCAYMPTSLQISK